jgi:hypothetical protein
LRPGVANFLMFSLLRFTFCFLAFTRHENKDVEVTADLKRAGLRGANAYDVTRSAKGGESLHKRLRHYIMVEQGAIEIEIEICETFVRLLCLQQGDGRTSALRATASATARIAKSRCNMVASAMC